MCFIKFNHILAVALRTIYSVNKLKLYLGFVGPHWEQRIVADLNSALNERIDKVPDHRASFPPSVLASPFSPRLVKWDTTGQNFRELVWFLQSASLYKHYYHLPIAHLYHHCERPLLYSSHRMGSALTQLAHVLSAGEPQNTACRTSRHAYIWFMQHTKSRIIFLRHRRDLLPPKCIGC